MENGEWRINPLVSVPTNRGKQLALVSSMPHPPEPLDQRSFRFACAIVKLYIETRKSARVPEHIARQFLAAGTSIGANLEEANAALSRRELAAKVSIALKEARETWYWLRLTEATGLTERQQTGLLVAEVNELIAILTTSQRRLRGQARPG